MSNARNGFLLAQTVCELTSRSTNDCAEGCFAYVSSTGQMYQMVVSDTPATVDGINVLSTYGGPIMAGCPNQLYISTNTARWILVAIPTAVNPFAAEANWYIDPVAGDDLANTGLTALSPLKTGAALAARWAGIATPTTVTVRVHLIGVATHLATGDQIVINRPVNPSFPIIVDGAFALATVTTGVLTTLTALNRATNTSVQINGTLAAGTWANYVGKIIRITSAGPSLGAWALIAEALGGANVRVLPFVTQASQTSPNLVQVSPANGSTFEIVEPIQLTDNVTGNLPYINVGTSGDVWFYNTNFLDDGLAAADRRTGVSSARTLYIFRSVSQSAQIFTATNCATVAFGASFANFDHLDVPNGDLAAITTLFQVTGSAPNGTLSLTYDSAPTVGTSITYAAADYDFSNVNITNALSPAIDLPAYATAVFKDALYGTGVATSHISLHNFVRAEYTSGATFPAVVAGGQHPLNFQTGILKDYADLPFGATATFSLSQALFLLQQ